MELPKYIHGLQEGLPATLAGRLSLLRNVRRLHITELSFQAKVSVKLLEDIEAGIETWLPISVRQRIARVLSVDPIILEEVEVRKQTNENVSKSLPLEVIERIQEQIILGERNVNCPLCNSLLRVWVQEGFDLNGEVIKSAKAQCTTCVFQLKN